MEARLLEKEKDRVALLFKDTTPVFLNTIRRIIVEEVPTMAIEDVEVRKNTSALYDEMLGHRLGLLPLTTDLKSYNLLEECKCEGKGCARCQVKLTLEGKGPGIVYASDIKSADSAIKPAFPKMPIVQLLKGQSIEIEATAVLGKGKVHSKWIPAHVYYKYKPKLTVLEKVDEKTREKAEVCPPGTLGLLRQNKDALSSPIVDGYLGQVCVEENPSEGAVIVEQDKDIILFIETFGQLDAKKVLQEAAKVLENMLNDFEKSLKQKD
ncbi:DNA-directed RNA polymerase subunit D [Candidatus Woesearchaeota archaeon]|nr:DNA-directed RNA polymerase subunit D [Candidatus Woesearchaeota archaeon]